MRLKISKSKNVTLYYVIKTIYIDGKEKTVTVEKLGEDGLKQYGPSKEHRPTPIVQMGLFMDGKR